MQAAALPRPTSPNSLDGPGATSSASVGAFSRGTPSSHPVQAEPSQGGGLPASPSKRALNTNNPPARSGAPAVPGVLESARASVQHRLGSPPSAAAGVPAEGVWAAWAELEQRIRAISGELAQRGGQHGEDTVPSDGVAGARPQDGNATGGIAPEEAVARPASHVAGHAGEVRPTGGRARVASADMHSTEVACIRKEPNGSPSKHSEMGSAAANLLGSALAAEPPGRGEEPPGGRTEPVRVSSPHLPLVGGPVSQPRPVFFPSKEAPLTNPPSYPQGILPAPHPPAVMPTAGMLDGQVLPAVALPRVPAGPAPAPAPAHSRPPVSSIPGRSAVQAPVDPAAPLPGCSDSTHSGTVAPLLGVRSGLPEGALNGGQGAGPSTRSGDAPLVLGGAASAAEVSYDVAGTDQGRGLACSDGQAGPAGECDAAEVSGMPDRGEAVCERVLRFDPTVGEAGAFYYVDVLPVEEDRRAGDGISEKTGGQGTKGGARSKGAEDISRRARVVSPSGGPGHYGRRRAAGDAEFERSAPSSLPDEAVADGGPVAEVPLVFVSAAPRGAPRVVVKESGPRDRSTSPEGSRSRGGEPGLARWVSGMLYDSALLELVEELEMGHARASRHDAARDLPAEWTAWARRTDGEGMRGKPNGVSQALPNANGRGKVQAARGRRERHPHFAQSHAEPEVLVLANGW